MPSNVEIFEATSADNLGMKISELFVDADITVVSVALSTIYNPIEEQILYVAAVGYTQRL